MPESSAQEPASVPRWRWGLHLGLLCAYVLAIGASGTQQVEGTTPALASSARGLLVATSFELATFAVVFAAALFASRASAVELRLGWRRGILPVPLGLLYSIALRLLVVIVAAVVAVVLVALGMVDLADLERLAREGAPDTGAMVSLDAMRNDSAYYWLMLT